MKKHVFTAEDPVLPMHYPGFIFRTLQKQGYETSKLLADTGLLEESLSDPNFRFSFSALQRLTLNALEQTNDPHLGIRLGKKFDANYIGLPAYAALNASDLQEALDIMRRYSFLAFPTIEFVIPEHLSALRDETVSIYLRPKFPLHDIAYFISSFSLMACEELLKKITQKPQVTVRSGMIVGQPSGWNEVSGEVGFSVSFNQSENQLMFPAKLLCEPLPGSDPVNHARLRALCEKFASDAGYEETPISRVMRFLEDGRDFSVSLSEAAAALGYSDRGLRRKLQQSGTSYRNLVEQVREKRARAMLTYSGKQISVIAHELGYETPSNFARSFKRWTGTTPKEYRENRTSEPDDGQI